MSVLTEKCALYPSFSVRLALYKDVENCDELKKMVMANEIVVALLNPKLVLDTAHLLAAVYRAVHLQHYDKMTTRSLHSEILFSLSPSKNITDAFRKFGMGEKDSRVLLVEVTEGESHMEQIQSHVHGCQVDVRQLTNIADTDQVKRVYKVKDAELQVGSLLDAVMGRMASKDFVNY